MDLVAASGSSAGAARALAAETGLSVEQAMNDVLTVLEAFGGSPPKDKKASPPRPVSARGALGVARSWVRLPGRAMYATAIAALLLGLVEVGLRTTDIRRLARWFSVPLSDDVRPPAPNGDVEALSHRDRGKIASVEWVLARWVYPATCLRRALLTGFFLRHRHPVLRLGMMADGETAHAWIEVDGCAYWVTDGLTPFSKQSTPFSESPDPIAQKLAGSRGATLEKKKNNSTSSGGTPAP